MSVIVDEVALREPNLLVPGKKPVGPVKIDQSISKKEMCFVTPSNILNQSGFVDLCGNSSVDISANHSVPYEHWHLHPLGINNYYGGDYNLAECLKFTGLKNTAGNNASSFTSSDVEMSAFGAVFTLNSSTTGSGRTYTFMGESPLVDAGHGGGGYNSFSLYTDTEFKFSAGSSLFFFTVPNLRDGKSHCAIGMVSHVGSLNTAGLIVDGTLYPDQTATKNYYYMPYMCGFTSATTHHNQTIDGVLHMLWFARNPNIEDLIEDSKDPYRFLIPA